jgi:competence protein ComEC
MIRWIPFIFIRITFFFTSGILLALYFPDCLPDTIAAWSLFGLAVGYLALFIFRKNLKIPVHVFGWLAFPALALAGYLHLLDKTGPRHSDHLLNQHEPVKAFTVLLTSFTEEKDRSWKMSGEVVEILTAGWRKSQGKVLLYFSKEDFKKPFAYGDVLLVYGQPQVIPAPSNPFEFDYKRFLAFRDTYHQRFIKSGDVQLIDHQPASKFKEYAIKARSWANKVLHQYVQGEQEQAVASALVLGVTDGLDNELLSAYAATGAMHVLAVSGLHISIIYLIILWLFKPIKNFKHSKIIIALVSLIILWAYAFITGLSPSVLRAVMMFTFIAIANATGRNTNIYNTLAASCFCLLLYDPYLIMSVGFQLSYLAVLGIVYLQPLIYRWWDPRTRFMDEVWKITCVSLAAQLATFSLGLLYFHQFPNYFLLSNLLVIPISFGVLVGGIILLAISFVPALAYVAGFLLTWIIKILNYSVIIVEMLPYSLIEGIHITTLQCWLLMGGIVFLILMVQLRKFTFLTASFICIVGFTLAQWNYSIENSSVNTMTVYKVPGYTAVDFISDGKAFFLADSSLLANAEKMRFHIKPNRLNSGADDIIQLTKTQCVSELKGARLIVWEGKTILQITSKEFDFSALRPDMVIISNNSLGNLESIANNFRSSQIIFDSSNSYHYTLKMLSKARELGLNSHGVMKDGAFVLSKKRNQSV